MQPRAPLDLQRPEQAFIALNADLQTGGDKTGDVAFADSSCHNSCHRRLKMKSGRRDSNRGPSSMRPRTTLIRAVSVAGARPSFWALSCNRDGNSDTLNQRTGQSVSLCPNPYMREPPDLLASHL